MNLLDLDLLKGLVAIPPDAMSHIEQAATDIGIGAGKLLLWLIQNPTALQTVIADAKTQNWQQLVTDLQSDYAASQTL